MEFNSTVFKSEIGNVTAPVLQLKCNSLKYDIGKVCSEIEKSLPQELIHLFRTECYFSGGCIYSIWNNREVKDFDIFATSKETVDKLTNHFIKNTNFTKIVTQYAITVKLENIPQDIQFIRKFYGEPEDVVDEFDFKHNMFYFRNGKLGAQVDLDYLYTDRLWFNDRRPRDISSTICRVPKFIERGMKISKSEMARILKTLVKNMEEKDDEYYEAEWQQIEQMESGGPHY